MLELFGKDLSSLLYLVADNAAVNTCLADLLEIQMIGCASHRFNLACKSYLQKYEATLSKVNSLMVTLRNVKQAGKLRTRTPLEPVTRNDTLLNFKMKNGKTYHSRRVTYASFFIGKFRS